MQDRPGLALATAATMIVGGVTLALISLGFAVWSGFGDGFNPPIHGGLHVLGLALEHLGFVAGPTAGGVVLAIMGHRLLRRRPGAAPRAAGLLVAALVAGVMLVGMVLAEMWRFGLDGSVPIFLAALSVFVTFFLLLPAALLGCLARLGAFAAAGDERVPLAARALGLLGLLWGGAVLVESAGGLLSDATSPYDLEPADAVWLAAGAWLVAIGLFSLTGRRIGPALAIVGTAVVATAPMIDARLDIYDRTPGERAAATLVWAVPLIALSAWAWASLTKRGR